MDKRISGLGSVMQLAFVPRDFDAALKFWTETMGVGPFHLLEHIGYDRAAYRGQPAQPDFSVAIAYWDDTQIELIQQHNDAPSIYTDWLDRGLEGLHHSCIVVDDITAARKVCTDAGLSFEQEIWLPGGAEAFYVDTGGGPGTMVEVIAPNDSIRGAFEFMREAARTWDGSDPVRKTG